MGKFCLAAVSPSYRQRLPVGAVLVLVLAGVPVQAASNQASAVLHIQVTVVPTVQAASTQPSATTSNGTITYTLQPSAPKMASQVTVHQISTTSTTSDAKAGGEPAKGAVLLTTTTVPE